MKTVCLLCCLLLFWPSGVQACTLWAVAGDMTQGSGTMLIKNRDWNPDHQQELKLVTPTQGYRYFGLFASGTFPGLKAGVNEKGFTVVSATASSIPRAERDRLPKRKGSLSELLKTCATVDEALSRKELFHRPQFLMMADKEKIAYVEIDPQGVYAIRSEVKGTLYHTNHYIEDALKSANRKVGKSSALRYERISTLLDTCKFYTPEDFISFSQDQAAGPDNSILRTGGKPGAARTLATWMVHLPASGEASVYVRLANPGQAVAIRQFRLIDIFSGVTEI